MKRYIRLYLFFLHYSLMGRLEYRFDFIANVIRSLIWFIVALFGFSVLYGQSSVIAGWTKAETLTLFGIFTCIDELWYALFFLNLINLPKQIEKGLLDRVLLYPISAQFLLSLRQVLIFTLPSFFVSLLLTIYYAGTVTKTISTTDVIVTLLLSINGLITLYSLTLIMITTSFWIVKLKAFWEFYSMITIGGKYPVDFFKGFLYFFFIFIIPLAIIFTFPAAYLVKGLSWQNVILSFLVGIFLFIISHKFFYKGIRRYNSASS